MKFITSLQIVIFSFSFSHISFAQWKTIGLPGGYGFNESYIDQEGNIFLDIQENLYYSDNHGQSWTNTEFFEWASPAYLSSLLETDDHKIYLFDKLFNKFTKKWESQITIPYKLILRDQKGYLWGKNKDTSDHGLYYSKDDGKTFKYISNSINFSPENIQSYSKDVNYLFDRISYYYQVYRFSEDGNFKLISPFTEHNNIVINKSTGTIFVFANGDTLCRSTDFGNTFIPLKLPFGAFESSQLQLKQMNNGSLIINAIDKIYQSEDDGLTWKLISTKAYPKTFALNSFVRIEQSDTILGADNRCCLQGIYLSNDNGKTWETDNQNFKEPWINKMMEDSKGNIYANVYTDTTLIISNNQGSSWSKYLIKYNNKNYGVKDFLENENGDVYLVTNYALFRISAGGSDIINLGLSKVGLSSYENILVASNGYIYVMGINKSYISKDNGNTWQLMNFSSITSGIDYKVDELGFLYSLNFGELYKYDPNINITEKIFIEDKFKVQFFNIDSKGVIYFGYKDYNKKSSTIWKSNDKLNSFEEYKVMPFVINNILIDKFNTFYLQGIHALYTSTDDLKNIYLFAPKPSILSLLNYKIYLSPFSNLYVFKSDISEIFALQTNSFSSSSLTGYVYKDSNKDCNFDLNELPKEWVRIKLNGNNQYNTFAGSKGQYNYKLNEGEYSVSTIVPNSLWESCAPINLIIEKDKKDSFNIDLGLQPNTLCTYLTVNLALPLLRRCFDNSIYIRYCNEGTLPVYGAKLVVELDDNLKYVSSSLLPAYTTDQELIYDLGDIPIGFCGDILVKANLSCKAELNSNICVKAEIIPVTQCPTDLPVLSKIEKCNSTFGSADPNNKTAYINGVPSNGQTEMNQDIEYVIRFQNTGNDTAFKVEIIDKIPDGYDLNSLKLLNSSHPFTVQIYNDRNVRFLFDPIMLPDSNTNEPASHGFIAFKISPKPDLPFGTKLDNRADIYFDFNAAVSTNTAFLMVSQATATTDLTGNIKLSYYPNPTKGELNIQLEENNQQKYTIRVVDILGQLIDEESWNGSSFSLMPKNPLQPGIYFIKVQDNLGKCGFGKFVVQ